MSAATEEPDWKAIATALARELIFVVGNIKAQGSGTIYNSSTGEVRHWKSAAADVLDTFPGIKVDREAMFYPEMSKKEKVAFNKARQQQAAPSEQPEGGGK